MESKKFIHLKRLTGSAQFLTLALVLPFFTGQVPEIGNMLCPMHIPVLICGMVYGPLWGGAVGFIAPLLRYIIFGMPPIYPTGVSMAFELLAYGVVAGLMIYLLPKKLPFVYVSLVTSMLLGRVVWAGVRTLITVFGGAPFTFEIFLVEGFANALPAIIVQIAIIPPIVFALRKARLDCRI